MSGNTPTNYSESARGRLATAITATQTTGITVTADTFTTPAGTAPVTFPTGEMILKISRKTRSEDRHEYIGVESGSSQSGATVTLGTVNRYMSETNGGLWTSVGSTGLSFPSGSIVEMVWTGRHAENVAFKNNANTFTQTQTISGTNKLDFDSSATEVWKDGSGNLSFKDAANGTKTLTTLAASAGADEKAKVSSNDTTQGYLNGKIVAGTGITLTENNDGSNETLSVAATNTVATGHTGLSTITSGALMIGNGTGNVTLIGPGTSGQVPLSNGTTIAMGTAPNYEKAVFISTADSSTLGASSTSDFNFDVNSYTISANDLVTGVAYRFDALIQVNWSLGSSEIHVKLGSTKLNTLSFTATGSTSVQVSGTIHGTQAAGASVTVRSTATIIGGNNGISAGAQFASTGGIATNGSLLFQLGGKFNSSHGSNSMLLQSLVVEKISTSAF